MRKRIEAVRRLKDQFADPCSVASQSVAAYSDLLDGAPWGGYGSALLPNPSPRGCQSGECQAGEGGEHWAARQ